MHMFLTIRLKRPLFVEFYSGHCHLLNFVGLLALPCFRRWSHSLKCSPDAVVCPHHSALVSFEDAEIVNVLAETAFPVGP